MRIALCHAWKMIGVAIVLTLFLYLLDDTNAPLEGTLNSFYRTIGYIIILASSIFILFLLFNEFRQRQGIIYNYRDCLDHDNAIANNYCKLFSKNEVIIERNPTVKSTENLLPRNKKNYTNLWTIYLMLPKLHGALMFHYFLVMMTFHESSGYVEYAYAKGIAIWIMAGGAFFGVIALRYVHSAKVYTLTSIVAVTALGVSYVFFQNGNHVIAICFWIYFLAISIASAVPDIALMEIAKIRFSEGALAIGFFLELIPIAVLQSTQRGVHEWLLEYWYSDKYFLPVIISTIVILIVTSMLYQLHMPNTHNKSLLQIQNELLKFKKYFAFDFDNDVNSAVPRRSFESDQYMSNGNGTGNVFEDHAKNISQISSPHNEYSNVMDKLPDPPVNNVKNFDYSTDIPRPPAIIPRVKIAKGSIYS